MTSLNLVFLITYQDRAESDLMARQIMFPKEGVGFGGCPLCLGEPFGLGGAFVEFRRYW